MRVAVYFTPPRDHPLVEAAAGWLGRDAFSGEMRPREPAPGFDESEVDALTADPRRYGFHATLKPPFRLAGGQSLKSVGAFATEFAIAHSGTTIPALALTAIGPFFALTPDGPAPPVDALAAAAVRGFEAFRAPLTDDELARRRPERLSERQRENLEAWGYPYVFDKFRFHMTLTGPVPEARRQAMRVVLEERFRPFIGRPLAIDALALFIEPETPGPFVVESLVPLGPLPRS